MDHLTFAVHNIVCLGSIWMEAVRTWQLLLFCPKMLYRKREMTFSEEEGFWKSYYFVYGGLVCVTSVRALSYERQSSHLRSLTHESI